MTKLDELYNEIKDCQKCNLCHNRTNLVFGQGIETADVLFVGEGPGENEDLQGLPFVGRSGQLLDKLLFSIGLDRNKNIYIGNMVKCRPPKNRDPLPEEIKACGNYLAKQIEIINPKVIVCLGRVAAKAFIDPNFMVTKEHGQFRTINGRLYMGTFHPAALLRNPNQKPDALADFLALRQKLLELGSTL